MGKYYCTSYERGFLSFLLPLLGALGVLGGAPASIGKIVIDAKAKNKQLEEHKRYALVMEQSAKGKCLYLEPYKGYGLYLKPHKKTANEAISQNIIGYWLGVLQKKREFYILEVYIWEIHFPKKIERMNVEMLIQIVMLGAEHINQYFQNKNTSFQIASVSP